MELWTTAVVAAAAAALLLLLLQSLRFGTSHAVVAVCTTAAAVFYGQIITGGNMADRGATPERGEFVFLSSAPAPSGRNSCLGPFPSPPHLSTAVSPLGLLPFPQLGDPPSKNWHGHWVCWMSTSGKNGLM